MEPDIFDTFPNGGPLYWKAEESGEMARVVAKFMELLLHQQPLGKNEFSLMVRYFRHWIDAPCWCLSDELWRLRDEIHFVRNSQELVAWYRKARERGIDPV